MAPAGGCRGNRRTLESKRDQAFHLTNSLSLPRDRRAVIAARAAAASPALMASSIATRSRQGRDLYDLWLAWTQSEANATQYAVDGKKAMQAFEWYLANEGTQIERAEAATLLSLRLRNQDFRNDMETLLRPGLMKFECGRSRRRRPRCIFRPFVRRLRRPFSRALCAFAGHGGTAMPQAMSCSARPRAAFRLPSGDRLIRWGGE